MFELLRDLEGVLHILTYRMKLQQMNLVLYDRNVTLSCFVLKAYASPAYSESTLVISHFDPLNHYPPYSKMYINFLF